MEEVALGEETCKSEVNKNGGGHAKRLPLSTARSSKWERAHPLNTFFLSAGNINDCGSTHCVSNSVRDAEEIGKSVQYSLGFNLPAIGITKQFGHKVRKDLGKDSCLGI